MLAAAIFYYPDYPASFWVLGPCGVLACLCVSLNFSYWRLVAILASCVYLLFYTVRVGRMVALTSGFEISSIPMVLSLYYKSSWTVTVAMLQETGVARSLMHGYIEYAMPILSIVLIVVAVVQKTRD